MAIPAPEYEWAEQTSTSVLTSDPASGAVFQGRSRDTNIRRFHLRWEHASQTAKDDLWTEYSTALGEAGTTTYTPEPRDEVGAVTVRFVGTPEASWNGGSTYAMTCTLEEILTPY